MIKVRSKTLFDQAINLRRQGLSYAEILREVKVAKSTLSLWLRDVNLSEKQSQKLTEKKIKSARRGGEKRHLQKIEKIKRINDESKKDVTKISKRELWLMGVMLYWAEGTKEKEWRPGTGIQFSNSDPFMIKIFIEWLRKVFDASNDDIGFEIYIHENEKGRTDNVSEFWARKLNLPTSKFSRIYFKKNKIKTNRKNTGTLYFGLIKVKVKASSHLNRKIAGWIKAINEYYWGVI